MKKVLAFVLLSALAVPARAEVITGNLFANPGGEAGNDGSWSGDSVRTGPASLPTGTIQATEGSNWFGRGPFVAYESPGTRVGAGAAGAAQWVDIRNFVGIRSITVGFDAFAVSEVASVGFGHEVKMRPVANLNLYDANNNWLSAWWGTAFFNLQGGVDVENKVATTPDVRQTFTIADPSVIPPEAVFLRVDLAVDSIVYNPLATNPLLNAQYIAGIDDAYLSITADAVVPEPGCLTMLTTAALAGLVWAAWRQRSR